MTHEVEMQCSAHVSLVVPTCNNETGIQDTLNVLVRSLEQCCSSFEVIVVVNGSTDHTFQKCIQFAKLRSSRVRCLKLKVPNKAKAVRYGFQNCSGEIWGFADGDLGEIKDHDAVTSAITAMLRELSSGKTDCVIGERQTRSGSARFILGSIFNKLSHFLFGLHYPDTQCGLKFITSDVGKMLLKEASFTWFEFDVEMLYLIKMKRFTIGVQPLPWDSSGKVNLVQSAYMALSMGIPMAFNLLVIRIRLLTNR